MKSSNIVKCKGCGKSYFSFHNVSNHREIWPCSHCDDAAHTRLLQIEVSELNSIIKEQRKARRKAETKVMIMRGTITALKGWITRYKRRSTYAPDIYDKDDIANSLVDVGMSK